MSTLPISEFEHRVARWAAHLEKSREPLEISQRGHTRIVVLDKQTYDEWNADRERLLALEVKLLVDEGSRALKAGRWKSHEAVGRSLRPKRSKRRA